MRMKSVLTHSGEALFEGFLIALLVVGLMVGTTLAGGKGGGGHKGGGGTTSATISVPDGVYGGTAVATVTPTGIWVYATCSQSGKQVYAQYVQSDSYGHATLQLGPTSWWSGGAASCSAQAGVFSSRSGAWTSQGSTTFSVAGQ
jgi:hypothetical protein